MGFAVVLALGMYPKTGKIELEEDRLPLLLARAFPNKLLRLLVVAVEEGLLLAKRGLNMSLMSLLLVLLLLSLLLLWLLRKTDEL